MTEYSDYQRGFEGGIEIGLRAAEAIVKRIGAVASHPVAKRELADAQSEIAECVAEMQDVKARREGRLLPEAAYSDIFLDRPLAHPGDLGMVASAWQEKLVRLSRMRIASADTHPKGGDGTAPFMSGAVAEGETSNPSPNPQGSTHAK